MTGKIRAIAAAILWLIIAPTCMAASQWAQWNRGVNLSHWFEFPGEQAVSSEELRMIRHAGFDHVRIPVNPVLLGWDPELGPEVREITLVRRAAEEALAAGLDVIIDLHFAEAVKDRIDKDARLRRQTVELWRFIADRFADLPSARIAFEVFNEPGFYSQPPETWNRYQRELVRAVRSRAADNLIIGTAYKGSLPEGFIELEPIDDRNIAYTFHFYLPYLFTHQGVEWMRGLRHGYAGDVHALPYPPAYIPVRTHGSVYTKEPKALSSISRYQKQEWDQDRISGLIQPAVEWALRHRVRLLCTEFGALEQIPDAGSRRRWLKDVRTALQHREIGWTVWDFKADFGVAERDADTGALHIGSPMRAALGLQTK